MELLLKIVFAIVVFWLWFFFGSRDNCPRCGLSLEREPLLQTPGLRNFYVASSCPCGWHAGLPR